MKQSIIKRSIYLLCALFATGIFSPSFAQRVEDNQKEIIEKRAETAKTFQLADGTYRAQIYGGPIHYKDDNTQWQDINTTVQLSANPSYQYENTTNGIKSYFPTTLAHSGVKVDFGSGVFEMGNQFTFSLDETLDAEVGENAIIVDLNSALADAPASNVVRYDGGHALGYVEYLIENNQVKQQFILENLPTGAQASSARYLSMSETITLPQGWSVVADGNPVTKATSTSGALQIRNELGDVVSGIPLPEIFEQQQNGALLNPDGRMEQSYFVKPAAGTDQYLIKVAIPMAWLTAADRTFPIVIDPNTVLPGGWGGWIDGTNTTVNGNPSSFVFVGALSGTDHLAYVQYLLSAIPDSVQVDSVLASFFMNNSENSGLQSLSINDMTTEFGPYFFPQGTDSVLLADFNNGTYTTFDVTSSATYGPINLGNQAAIDLRSRLCLDTFQLALTNGNQSWKRFTSGLCNLNVYYSTCTGVAPTVVETFHLDENCAGLGASTISAPNGNSIFWPHNGDTSLVQTGLTPGNYAVLVDDTSGCGSVLCISILPGQNISAVVNAIDVSCAGNTDGTASATVAGGVPPFSYQWSNNATTDSISGLSPATYSVIATDSLGCIDSTSFTIGAPSLITLGTTTTNASCNGLNDGTATASASGGTGSKTYVWSNGDSTATASNLIAGTYFVTATDANGCTTTDSVIITEPVGFAILPSVDSMISCNGLNDGVANVSVTTGSGSFNYLWSNSDSTATISGLAAGTYFVTVTDVNSGCFKMDSVTVIEPLALSTGAMVASNISCNGLNDGMASSLATGGTGSYSYLWSNSDTTAASSGLAPGTYGITVTDSMGCMAFDSVVITEPTALLVSASVDSNVSCNGLSDGSASAMANGGTGISVFMWSTMDTTMAISNLAAGTYTVTATDSNGCTAIDTVTVTQPAAIDVSVTLSGNTVSANQTGATYQWLDCDDGFAAIAGETNQTFTGTVSGLYAVEITVNACSDTSACTAITVVGTDLPFDSNGELSLYPNPSTGQVMVRIEGASLEMEPLRIFSMTGQLVIDRMYDEKEMSIDLTHLSNGVYVVQYQGKFKKLVLRK